MFRSLVLILVLAASAANAQGVSHDSAKGASAHQDQSSPKPDPYPSKLDPIHDQIKRIADAFVAENKQADSPEEKNQAERNLKAQETLAFWAPFVFYAGSVEIAITLLGVIFVWLTLKETRRNGQAQIRAYLSCDNAQYMVMAAGFWCWPDIRNTGQSPAKNIELQASVSVTDFPEGKAGKIIREHKTSIVPPIPAGQTDNGMFNFPDVQLQPEEIDDFGRPLLIRCLLSWDDVFDTRNSIAFDLIKSESADVEGEGARRRLVGVMRPMHRTPSSDEDLRRQKGAWRGFAQPDEKED